MSNGVLAELRGEQVRIYHSDVFQQQMVEEIENAIFENAK